MNNADSETIQGFGDEWSLKSVLKNYSRHIIKLNYLSILNQQVGADQ
jgi:hypothetical protein